MDVRVELEQARGIESADRPAGNGGVALVVRVLPPEHDAAALLELEVRQREPGGDLVGRRDRAPHALDRVGEPPLEPNHLMLAAALERAVCHFLSPS